MIKLLKKQNNGITLIALVITIIVLLILAGVAISTLSGDNGTLKKASNAKEQTEEATIYEELALAFNSMKIGNITKRNGIVINTDKETMVNNLRTEGFTYNITDYYYLENKKIGVIKVEKNNNTYYYKINEDITKVDRYFDINVGDEIAKLYINKNFSEEEMNDWLENLKYGLDPTVPFSYCSLVNFSDGSLYIFAINLSEINYGGSVVPSGMTGYILVAGYNSNLEIKDTNVVYATNAAEVEGYYIKKGWKDINEAPLVVEKRRITYTNLKTGIFSFMDWKYKK